MSTRPLVTCIIISFNRCDDLRLSIEAIFASDYPRDSIELIVVDNASKDDAADVAESFPGVRVIRNSENRGFAEANNQAMEFARGEYIALVNNDAVLSREWIPSFVALLEEHSDAAAAGGKMYVWNDENPLGNTGNRYFAFSIIDAETGYSTAYMDSPDTLREVATLSGAAVLIRRRAIDDVGGAFLEPTFFAYYEETDFFARALRRGWKLLYRGEPGYWHRIRASTSTEPYRYLYFMFRNRILYACRNFDDRELFKVMLDVQYTAVELLRKRPREFFRGDDDELRARRDAWRWLLDNRALVMAQRRALRGLGRSYNETVRSVQARAEYFGYARPEIVALVPETAKHVVDVGCGAGAVGARLKELRPGTQVRGVEIAVDAAERAKRVLDDVMVGRAEDPPPADWPAPDCVILADVLEHLVDPWRVLQQWRERLAPGGSVVISIPNVLHSSVLEGLAFGRFDYGEAGVLDRTHLRFFTRATAIEMVERAGLRVQKIERVRDTSGISSYTERVGLWFKEQQAREAQAGIRGPRSRLADVLTVQFLIVATP